MTQTATLTFDLTDPDARKAFELATKAQDMVMAMRSFSLYLRDEIKHREKEDRDDTEEVLDKLLLIMSNMDINVID